jgi:hypothetical protein
MRRLSQGVRMVVVVAVEIDQPGRWLRRPVDYAASALSAALRFLATIVAMPLQTPPASCQAGRTMESVRRVKPRVNRAKIEATSEADIRWHMRADAAY